MVKITYFLCLFYAILFILKFYMFCFLHKDGISCVCALFSLFHICNVLVSSIFFHINILNKEYSQNDQKSDFMRKPIRRILHQGTI